MSSKNGNISRYNRLRKKKIAKRLSTRTLRESLTAAATAAAPEKPTAA